VVAALWKAKPGKAEIVAEVIETMTPLSRQEPGCLYYQAQRSIDDPDLFFLYEQYTDPAAYEAHMATPHFEEHVRGRAIPNLESRERSFYQTL
ncbi:MAG TPA: antibiotic biosynthesis monooxygenase family protein, partial [Ktedonobacteraceae bacterium]